MNTPQDAALIALLDQDDRRTALTIRERGTSVEYVFGDLARRETPFAYTIGLFGWGHPELLVFGLDRRIAALLLDDVAERVRAGGDVAPGDVLSFAGWSHRTTVEAVPNPGDIVIAANRFYRRPADTSVDVLQLTYDDRDGRFPWDDDYANAAWIQPRPGRFRA